MNVLRFINSKDVRKHLEDIGYEFNSLEAAWIIYWCRSAPTEEKHRAWNELIATMPDCQVRHDEISLDSLHEFLKEHMAMEDRHAGELVSDGSHERVPSCDVFEALFFDFPVPFKKGDIIWRPHDSAEDLLWLGPIVFLRKSDNVTIQKENGRWYISEYRDVTDMCVYGFFSREDGSIYRECLDNYMDMEYYDGEMSGPKRNLAAMSDYLKGKISAEEFVETYRRIISETKMNK